MVKKKKKIIIASGYFDPIHCGHIEYLKLAKEIGTKLIVIVNNDKQAILKKGKPFMNEADRVKIVQAIRYVDEVYLSTDENGSVCNSIKDLSEIYTISIFAKGGDRYSYEIPEGEICKELGIEIVDSLGKKIRSSSELINDSIYKESK